AGTLAQRVVVADLARGECRERPFAAFGDDVDDTTDGIGAVECRLRTPNDLDPLDLAERYVGEVEGPRRWALHPHAVDQDLDLVRGGATDADLRLFPEAAGALHLQSRHLAEGIVHGHVVVSLQLLLGDDGHRRAHLRARLGDLRRRDDHRVDLPFLLRPRRGGVTDGRDRRRYDESQSVPHGFTPFSRRVRSSTPDRSPDSWIPATSHLPIRGCGQWLPVLRNGT